MTATHIYNDCYTQLSTFIYGKTCLESYIMTECGFCTGSYPAAPYLYVVYQSYKVCVTGQTNPVGIFSLTGAYNCGY